MTSAQLFLTNVVIQTAQAALNSGVKFAQIDVMENAAICQNFDFASYQALMLFQASDKNKKYHGRIEAEQ